jgi:HSP20 family protein
MSNMTLWSRPAWNTDRWLREFFGPAAANDWFKPLAGFNPAAEITKDGDDAVIRLELPGVDVEKDVNVDLVDGRLVIHGERRDEHGEEEDGRTLQRSATDRSGGHSNFLRTSPAGPSRRRMTPAC